MTFSKVIPEDMSVVKQALLCSKFEVVKLWIPSAQGRHNKRISYEAALFQLYYSDKQLS